MTRGASGSRSKGWTSLTGYWWRVLEGTGQGNLAEFGASDEEFWVGPNYVDEDQ